VHNALDMLNVCIAPTRLCNLSCTHCYVDPQLLRDRSMMPEATFRASFDRIEELFNRDQKVTKINIELLGGELTMMPLAYWQRNLPWALERMANWASIYDAEAALIWCTNLIFKDEGYIGLLNEMGRQFGYGLDVFVPWEPDTNRFLRGDKLLPRYFRTLEAITEIPRKTLCITMSRGVIERGPQFIVDEFVSRGITDITCDMLYPAGSGKEYFLKTCTYGEVSRYILDLKAMLPAGITISPFVEMEQASKTLTHFHYPGNDTYDLEIEPDGLVTFNSSYTASEAIFPTKPLSVSDPLFALKAIFNNTPEMVLRHQMPYPECGDCRHAVVCSGGWAWHKNLDANMRSLIARGDCAGLKQVWEEASKTPRADRSSYLDLIRRRGLRGTGIKRVVTKSEAIVEASFAGRYDAYFSLFESYRLVAMTSGPLFDKSWIERLFFYDAVGSQIDDSGDWYERAALEGGEELYRHIVYRNYQQLSFNRERVHQVLLAHPHWELSKKVSSAISLALAGDDPSVAFGVAHHEEAVEFSVALTEGPFA
jgi:hypothetical protein